MLIIIPFVTGFHKVPLRKNEQILKIPAIGSASIKSNKSIYINGGFLYINVFQWTKSETQRMDIISDRIVPIIKKTPIAILLRF